LVGHDAIGQFNGKMCDRAVAVRSQEDLLVLGPPISEEHSRSYMNDSWLLSSYYSTTSTRTGYWSTWLRSRSIVT
jgi:hypothetical protein